MEKAYDLKDLVNRFKASGIEIAEETAKVVMKDTFGWFKESAALSATPVDDLVAAGLTVVEPKLFEMIEKINSTDVPTV
jgi:hypothetical protein